MFAAIDDSQLNKNGLYVYSHALIIQDQEPKTITFIGSSPNIYYPRSGVNNLIYDHLPSTHKLLACAHYVNYHFWHIVNKSSQDKLFRFEKKLLTEAHHLAKTVAKESLERYLTLK